MSREPPRGVESLPCFQPPNVEFLSIAGTPIHTAIHAMRFSLYSNPRDRRDAVQRAVLGSIFRPSKGKTRNK